MAQSHLADTVVEILARETQYHVFDSRHQTSGDDPFTGETAVWIDASIFPAPGPPMAVRSYLPSQQPRSTPMQTESPTDDTLASLPVSQPSMQADGNKLMDPLLIVRE